MSNVVPMYGFGGGGEVAIGLKVVGGLARPANPSEGLVWAKTDVEPTGYHLSSTAPENPTAGMLWIKISDSANVEIGTALGKDYITIMLDSVSQYVNGAWKSVESMSFQNGVWNGFILYLYNKGNEYKHITGGWTAVAKRWASSWSDANAGKVTIAKGSTSVKATFSYNGTNYASGLLCTEDDFDLTGKKYIKARCKISASNQYTYGWLGVFDRSVSTVEDAFVAFAVVNNTEFAEITVPLDNANLNGLYAIGIGMRVDGINNVSPEIEYLEVG